MQAARAFVIALGVGVLHAGVLVLVAIDLGYAVGPSAYTPVGLAWRYGGLVLVAAVPVVLAVRYRLVVPLAALVVTSAWIVGMELTPPGPTFRDVAELERLAQPTGILVVEDGLYVVRYMVNATVWTVGFLFLGLVEHAVRVRFTAPLAVEPIPWLTGPLDRRRSVRVAAGAGLFHALVMTWYAARLGVTVTGVPGWAAFAFGAAGMWLLAAVPVYALVRHRLLLPAGLLTALMLYDVQAGFAASVEDPHALYFAGWWVLLAFVLLAGALERGTRAIGDAGG